jgi:DNA helicase IV
MATLSAPRTGYMHDIVATIQREQDQIIRAPMRGVLVVQGGPGTGKTAVALHRAAYLLYSQRDWLAERRVLVVGPTRRFLRYVERVLPSLGETVVLRTVDQLVPDIRIGATDAADAARVKGDHRMVAVLTRAVDLQKREGSRRRGRPTPTRVLRRLWSDAEFLTRAAGNDLADEEQRTLRRSGGAQGWTLADACLLDELTWILYGDLVAPTAPSSTRDDGPTADLDADHIVEELVASSQELSDSQRAVLAERIRSQHARAMGEDDAHPEELYGHVVIDEAQELSPMQWRVIGRRCPTGSMTVVGDMGQASAAMAARSWDEVVARIPGVKAVDVRELTINYRTPSEIAAVAGAVLAVAAPDLTPPQSIRSTGHHPGVTEVTADADLGANVAGAVTQARDAIEDGTIAVVCPDDLAGPLTVALVDLLTDERVVIIPIGEAHGLEFDAVIVTEPARIVAASPRGLGALYVALTRATRYLHVVHQQPLPRALAGQLEGTTR